MGHIKRIKLTALIVMTSLLLSSCKQERPKEPTFSDLITIQKPLNIPGSAFPQVENYEITYKSDGLTITGYLFKPSKPERFPVILSSRGGNRDFGTYQLGSFDLLQEIASKAYVTLTTQLRGNRFNEGEDEMGGKDLNDILRLIEIAKTLDFADS